MNVLKRLLAGLICAIPFGIIVPLGYVLFIGHPPSDNFFSGILLLAAYGFAFGAILGVLFPKVVWFFLELFFDV